MASTALGSDDWQAILGLVAQGIEAPSGSLTLVDHEVVRFAEETRLRFNAPTPVEAWTLKLSVRLEGGSPRDVEVELFYWLSDEEWELCELAL